MNEWLIEYNGGVFDIVSGTEESALLAAENHLREICGGDEEEMREVSHLMRVWLYEDHDDFADLDFSSYDYNNHIGSYQVHDE